MSADTIRFIEETGIPIVSLALILFILNKISCSENREKLVLKMVAYAYILFAAIGFATGKLVQKGGSLGPIDGPFAYIVSLILLFIGFYTLKKLP